MVGLEGVMTKAVESVDVAARTVTVKGGEVFALGTPSPVNETTLEEFAEFIAKFREADQVR